MTKNLIRLKALHEASPHSSPHRRRSIFISLAILIALIAPPPSYSGFPSEDGPVTLSVTSPTDGAEV